MKKVKSGATKRREKAAAMEKIMKYPKLTHFLKPAVPASSVLISTNNFDCDYLGTRLESDGLIYDSNAKSNVSHGLICESNATTNPLIFLSDDPSDWPDNVSDAQKCDVVKRGLKKIEIDFPKNSERRRFSMSYYNRKMKNGEIFERSWLIYSLNSDKVFCFCRKLFGITSSPFRKGINTWEGLSKKLKEHETCSAHLKCFEHWMTLRKGIANQATIDEQQQKLLHKERVFWRSVLERILDITLFLSSRNLAFRGSDTAIGSKSNGNFLGVFELLAKYDAVFKELLLRIQDKKTNAHYLSNDTQNELIRCLAQEIESENLSMVKKAKYYSVILDCTPDVSHKEQMSIILRSVTCTSRVGINISENFFGYLTVNDTTGKGLLDAFLNQAKKWDLNILDCRGQSYDNGANMKGKLKGVQARLLEMNPKAIYVPCANHSLNLVIVDGALSSISAISFFGVLTRLYTLFSSSPPRWEILKSCVEISVKPQSDTRWESKINCVKPLRYYLKEILEALDRLEKHAFEKKDGATATEVRSLIEYIRTWPFLLSIIIWYDVLFQINKSSKLLQSSTTSLDILASEIKATNTFLHEYRETGFTDAHIKAQEIAEELGIEKIFPTVRLRKKKKMYSYECADETRQPEHQYKADFFLPLIDMSIASVKERFEQVSIFTNLFDFLYRSESLIKACNENSLTVFCTNLQTKLGDIDSEDLEMELKRFVIVVQEDKNTNLKSAYDFLNYVYKEELQETYPNLVIALRIILTSPVTVASAERSFSKLKLIKTFHRSV
ncbi:zinc finger MYM-type protein 1-like [Hydra vulgaris]|uniref:zinc finger MYM-type protein 1-like n=1 Tax=Hydra vulgaris TaxID=6087 RepID=UPI001F5ED1E8|nr:zinc finger MYM-type protein 1-like [Hydra vulgaris]